MAALVFSGSVRIALLTLSNIQRDGGICVFLAVMFDAHGTSDFFASAFPFIALGLPCVFLLFLGALLGVYLTQAVASWAFGWTHLSIGLLVELAVEPLPFGEHSLTHIDWTEGRGLEGIVHSWTYEHPVAVQRVRNWVEASLSAPPENRSPSLSVR
ncbi:hypothetical protein WN72_35720 [Bradyrhizobium arachidis]|uniref:Uncharacterized protein n=1 Tax=Bradyrhizobium arachidis TaxID=858423 RepID=A0AAE7TKG8_9BRAD|nr:hypothetical protein WN72_35720 [Bradyrhizobium arachidis]